MASPGQQFVVDFPVGSELMGSGQFCLAVLLDSAVCFICGRPWIQGALLPMVDGRAWWRQLRLPVQSPIMIAILGDY